MKTCPKCGGNYSDDLIFCLQDGSPLVGRVTADISNRPTDVFPPRTQLNTDISTAETIVAHPEPVSTNPKHFQMSVVEPSSRVGCVVRFGQVAAGFLVVAGLGFAGLMYSFRGGLDLARVDTPASNKFAGPPTIATPPPPAYDANSGTGSGSGNKLTPTPSVRNGPKMISGGVLNDKAVNLPVPIYPPAARAVKATGMVSVQVIVDEAGSVASANAVSGHPLLRNAAVQAAYGAKFSPTIQNGKPLRVSGVLTYNFVP